MALSKEEAVERARKDLARRLNISPDEVKADSVEEASFPDAALGAPIEEEMSAQMITNGWRIRLSAREEGYEYRAGRDELRLYNFKGSNHRV